MVEKEHENAAAPEVATGLIGSSSEAIELKDRQPGFVSAASLLASMNSEIVLYPIVSSMRMFAISEVRCAARSRFCAISCVAMCCSSAAAAIWCDKPESSSVCLAMLSIAGDGCRRCPRRWPTTLDLNLCRSCGSLPGQLPNLARHHAEPLAMHAGAGRLNVCIQRQHAGLRGDRCDQIRHLRDAAA